MSRHMLWGGMIVLVGILTLVGYWKLLMPTSNQGDGIRYPAENVAAYLRSALMASRAVYETNVVKPMESQGIAHVAVNWKKEKALPLPDQLILDTGRYLKAEGLDIRLISFNPLNPDNTPKSKFEHDALADITRNPAQPVTNWEGVGSSSRFHAVYAEVASDQTCVACHNSMKQGGDPVKLGDTLGAMVISLPAPQEN